MLPHLVFDIETIPDIDGLRRLNDIDTDIPDEEILEQARAERIAQTGSDFFPLQLQRIVAISCVFRDDQGFRVRSLGDEGTSEAQLLKMFFKTVDYYTPRLVSWNGSGFDLPVMHYRSLIHGVSSSRYWDQGEDDREFKFNNYLSRYHQRHIDLMDLLARYNGRANAPLDQVAKLCGFPGKLGMDGSQVWDAYAQGHLKEIRDYCETDVVNTWLTYCRFMLIKTELTQEAYESEIELVKQTLSDLAEEGAQHWEEYLFAWQS